MGGRLRRVNRLGKFAIDVLALRRNSRHLSPAIWAAIAGLIYAILDAKNIGVWFLPTLVFGTLLAGVMLFDGRYFIVPNHINTAIAASGALALTALTPQALPQHLTIALLAYLFLRGINVVYRSIRGRDGLGHGDAKLLAACGLWLTGDGLASALVWALGSALLSVAILHRVRGNVEAQTVLAFGVHLALGAWLTWVVGPIAIAGRF
jgi:leader peptidase (prepilin peptidase) / N-methyltransferase